MVFPDAPPESSYRFAWFEIVFGTVAVVALTALLFFTLLFLGSLAMVLATGLGSSQAWLESLGDLGARPLSQNAQLIGLMIGYALYAAIYLSVIVIARNPHRMPLARRVAFADWALDRQFWTLLAGCFIYAIVSGYLLESALPEAKQWNVLPNSPPLLFLAFFLIVAVGPFCEELLVRGWIFTALRTRLAFAPTLLITSVIFALIHPDRTLLFPLVVFPLGLAFGFVRERYGSIKASATFHGLYNLFVFVVTLFDIA